MKIQTSRHTLTVEGELSPFRFSSRVETPENGVELVHISLEADAPAVPPQLKLRWMQPSVGIHAHWTPTTHTNRFVDVEWSGGYNSNVTSGAPVHCSHGIDGRNRLTFAFSDALNNVKLIAGLREESGELSCSVTLFEEKTPPTTQYNATLRIDNRAVAYYESLRDVSNWWAQMIEYSPAPVPEVVRLPMYSTWYSFHQNLNPHDVEEQCRIAKSLGCEAVIVDDGWQTDDNSRGYAFCGDWEVTPSKIPDMKAHVARVHDLGMKYLLWYSVPFVGPKSGVWERFKDKLLRFNDSPTVNAGTLDPRFPDVREYLINLYENALRDWDLDGFKLDFVDEFWPDEKTRNAFGEGRDYDSIPAAVDRLLTDTLARLRVLKPDVMVEFRQSYIGPLMRKYGNMFRAGDCPNDAIGNRMRTIDIRLLCGDTACHSDMTMWHPSDSVESAALQMANILFSVPQVSMMLDKLTPEHLEMTTFYLDFWREHRDVLLDGDLQPHHPENFYPIVVASNEKKWLAAAYNDIVVTLPSVLPSQTLLVNSTLNNRVVVESSTRLAKNLVVRDCRGRIVREEAVELNAGLHSIEIPPCGVAVLS